jgi:hypothetical protein
LFVNGKPYDGPVETLELINPRFGRVSYGDDPSHQFDGVCIAEPGGGGQQIMPFAIIGGKLHVGVVPEWRRNHGRVVLNVPRGWKDPELSHLESALVEADEEVGVSAMGKIFRLPGKPANFNSAWAVTLAKDEGFVYFAFEVAEDGLTRDGDSNTIFANAHEPIQGTGEKIFKCRFIPWHVAMGLEDNFTVAGVGRLMAYLIATGRGDCLTI